MRLLLGTLLALVFVGVAGATGSYPYTIIVTSGEYLPSDGTFWLGETDGKGVDVRAAQNRPDRPWTLKFKLGYEHFAAGGPYTVRYTYWSDETPNSTWPSCSMTLFVDGTATGRSGKLPGSAGVHAGSFQTGPSTNGVVNVKVACNGRPDQFKMRFDELSVSPQ